MESRRIFKRLKAYVIYRICVTVQVVAFLCVVSFVYNDVFEALYIILLALFHDLTIVTIAYDHQTPSMKPEIPTVAMLIFIAYSMGRRRPAPTRTSSATRRALEIHGLQGYKPSAPVLARPPSDAAQL